jgi:broad specificity phosphatase PhoE
MNNNNKNIIDKNIIIISHSRRMRKILKDYFINYLNKRFKNCCILLIKFDINLRKTTIKIIYEGKIDKNEKRNNDIYYTKDKFNSLDIYSDKLIVPENINIFIIRHAQGYHNLTHSIIDKTINKTKIFFNLTENVELKDPQLTNAGIDQAKECGLILNKYIIDNNLDKNKFLCFCSILYRTRQTIKYILSNCILNISNIYVLPCNQELSNINNENKISYGRCKNGHEQELYECKYIDLDIDLDINDIKDTKKNIHWNYYINFKENNNICSGTNMIYETYLLFAEMNNQDIYQDIKYRLKKYS